MQGAALTHTEHEKWLKRRRVGAFRGCELGRQSDRSKENEMTSFCGPAFQLMPIWNYEIFLKASFYTRGRVDVGITTF